MSLKKQLSKRSSIRVQEMQKDEIELLIRPGLDYDEIEELKLIFQEFDLDKNGYISMSELLNALTNLGFNPQNPAIFKMIQDIDKDGNGQLEFSEFLDMMITRKTISSIDLKKIFDQFDEEKKGHITIKNLQNYAEKLGEKVSKQELEILIKKGDFDADGKFSFYDFEKVIVQKDFAQLNFNEQQKKMDSYEESENIEGGEKVIIVGDSGVGKTSIVQRYVNGNFSDNLRPTIGCDHYEKEVDIKETGIIKLSIWDTAGQDRFRGLASFYYKKAKCVILVFDYTRKTSFEKLDFWKDEIQNFADEDIITVLVGNKIDLASKFEVKDDDVQKFVEKNKFYLIKTSALENENIEQVFIHVAKQLGEKNNKGSNKNVDKVNKKDNKEIKIDEKKEEKGGCCG